MGPALIHDYGIIGNGRSAALVGLSGSIDWLCWPRFDSPSLFAALLDRTRGGHFLIAPAQPFTATRSYVEESNVLCTTFTTPGGEVRVTDLMPVLSEEEKAFTLFPEHEILRVCTGTRGLVEMRVEFHPRPDYARRTVPIRATRQLGFRIEDGPRLYTLRADRPLALVGPDDVDGTFLLAAGERATFSLSFDHVGPAVLPPLGDGAALAVERTVAWWRRWAGRCNYDGPYRPEVVRSVLALKLLSYAPSGAIVAAPTTSLPERIGGDLNWDYRFCWLRDAAFTARAFLALGYDAEAAAFCDWLLHATRLTVPRLRVLYDVYGRPPPPEREVPGLSGWRGARPVRSGNAAAEQLQLDLHGEVIDAVAQLARAGHPLDREARGLLRALGDHVARSWRAADHGIWEDRAPQRHHVHSRLLCWVALDRLLDLRERGLLDRGDADAWGAARAAIRAELELRGFSARLGAYARTLDGDTLDASALLLSWYGFHPPDDPRLRATFARIRERLAVGPGLYLRYEESRAAREGAFGLVGFWAAEHLARGGGSLEEARAALADAAAWANDLGLFAEEVEPATGEALGNFPQAYTHVGLVNAAVSLAERERLERGHAPRAPAAARLTSGEEASP
jgi:GH15 family glucan-1,4-alpha-glucosidase